MVMRSTATDGEWHMSQKHAAKLETILSFGRFCRGLEYPRTPLELTLEISNVCDLKCAMCTEFSNLSPYRFKTLQQKNRGFLREGDIANRLHEILEGALLVNCFGYGEPTLHPDFKTLVAFIAEYGVLVSFTTNGMHIDEELANILVDNNIFRVTVSFSGLTKDDYENVYIGGDYAKVLAAIRRLADAKRRVGKEYPIIEINSLGFVHHVKHFDEFVRMMADSGANVVYLQKLQPLFHISEMYEHVCIPRSWVEGEIVQRAVEIGTAHGVTVSCSDYLGGMVSTQEEFDARAHQMKAAAQIGEGRPYGQTPISVLREILKPQKKASKSDGNTLVVPLDSDRKDADQMLKIEQLPETKNNPFYCMEPFKSLYVNQRGLVRPCCFSGHSKYGLQPFLGNASDQNGIDIWNGAAYQAIRGGVVSGQYPKELCGRCVRERIGPTDHHAAQLVNQFLS